MTNDALVVLGATGSIGTQTLEIAKRRGLDVVGLAAARASDQLAQLALEWPDARVVVTGAEQDLVAFGGRIGAHRLGSGADQMVSLAGIDATVVNGVVGIAGLPATLAALGAGNRLALANKESLVAAGNLVRDAAAKGGGELLPVDSEHSAVFQLLRGVPTSHVHSIVLTASGGPFRGWTHDQLEHVSPAEALKHPTWNMGNRITIDSATMANKGLEVIEASVLFDVPIDRIEVVVHPQSIVHSMIRLTDGALLAHVGETNMRHPIEYALTHPDRADHTSQPFDLAGLNLTFEPPDHATFRALELAYRAGRTGGCAPAVFNAADEIAVTAFLDHRIGFTQIPDVIEATLDEIPPTPILTIEDVLTADASARRFATTRVAVR